MEKKASHSLQVVGRVVEAPYWTKTSVDGPSECRVIRGFTSCERRRAGEADFFVTSVSNFHAEDDSSCQEAKN